MTKYLSLLQSVELIATVVVIVVLIASIIAIIAYYLYSKANPNPPFTFKSFLKNVFIFLNCIFVLYLSITVTYLYVFHLDQRDREPMKRAYISMEEITEEGDISFPKVVDALTDTMKSVGAIHAEEINIEYNIETNEIADIFFKFACVRADRTKVYYYFEINSRIEISILNAMDLDIVGTYTALSLYSELIDSIKYDEVDDYVDDNIISIALCKPAPSVRITVGTLLYSGTSVFANPTEYNYNRPFLIIDIPIELTGISKGGTIPLWIEPVPSVIGDDLYIIFPDA